jgi:glycosyltransferase involved in cell wall biosynthesis
VLLMKKILLLADWFAPGYKAGGPIQSCVNFAREMADEYQIFVLTSDRDLGDTQGYEGIEADKWLDFGTNIKVCYLSPTKLNFSALKQWLCAEKFDFWYINSLYSVHFTIQPLLIHRSNKSINSRLVFAPRGALKESALSIKKYKKLPFIYLLKLLGFHKLVHFQATDTQEQVDIEHYFGKQNKITIIPNFPKIIRKSPTSIAKEQGKLQLVYVSRVHKIKNLDFFLQSLRNQTQVTIDLHIYGSIEQPQYWNDCQTTIQKLPKNITVQYQGELPNHRVCPTIAQSHLFILPTHGENFGHAIWEAFLVGRPVLISDQTPWRNLEAQGIGWDLNLQNPDAWRNAIEAAAEWSQDDFDKMCENVTTFAQNYIKNNSNKELYRQVFS